MDLTKYIPLLHKVALKFPEEHRQDLVQEGFIQLYELSKKYDSERSEPFETYAYKRIYYSMIDFLRRENQFISLDNLVVDEDGELITHADLLESEENVEQEIENRDYYVQNLNNSTVIERFIKERFFKYNMTLQDIVDLYQELTNVRSIKTALKIIRN